MTHFHDNQVKEALLDIAPQEKESIESSKFGEITGSYVILEFLGLSIFSARDPLLTAK
jgi:hypothetical protein